MVNLADYQAFIAAQMQIPTTALPPNSPTILTTLAVAKSLVNPALCIADSCPDLSLGYIGPGIYEFAVYNLAGDLLVNFAQDQPGQTYFFDLRKSLNINNFVPGLISESHDETTGESLLNQEFMKTLTMSDLQRMKTPWGRQYLMFAQSYGTLLGVS
jgi:hypothetical protein